MRNKAENNWQMKEDKRTRIEEEKCGCGGRGGGVIEGSRKKRGRSKSRQDDLVVVSDL